MQPNPHAADGWIAEFGQNRLQLADPNAWAHSFEKQHGANGWASEFEHVCIILRSQLRLARKLVILMSTYFLFF